MSKKKKKKQPKLGKDELIIKKLPMKHRKRLAREVELLLISQMAEGLVRTDILAQNIAYLVAATIVGTRKPAKSKVIEKNIASFAPEGIAVNSSMPGMPGMPMLPGMPGMPNALFGQMVTKMKEAHTKKGPPPPPPPAKKKPGFFGPSGFPKFPHLN